MDPVAFLQQWGWLVGIAWLAVVVIWAAKRPDAGKRAHSLHRLKDAAVLLFRRFEVLSSAYEALLPADAKLEDVKEARKLCLFALRDVILPALDTTPSESREEYRGVLGDIATVFYLDRSFPASRFSHDLPPFWPVMEVIKILNAKEEGKPEEP